MNLEIIRTQTTWNDAAESINSNYAKIADAIAQLKANGGGGGSGADIDLTAYATKVWVEAKGYITASALTPYALKTDIPSLVGYATEDFVNNKLQNYTTTEDLVENYASKKDLESAINDIDLSAYLLKADLTKSRIQSTLGISDWALAAIKPSYAWSEITSRPTALSQFTDDVVAGKYLPLSGGSLFGAIGISSGNDEKLTLNNTDAENMYQYISFQQGGVEYGRLGTFGYNELRWSDNAILHSGNIGNYNAGSATKLANYYTSRPSSANLTNVGDGAVSTFKATSNMSIGAPPVEGHILHFEWDNTGSWNSQLCIANNDERVDGEYLYPLRFRTQAGYDWDQSTWHKIALINETHANALINTLSTGSSDATMDDYIVCQYAAGGSTYNTYHRRPLSKLLTKDNIVTGLGYTPLSTSGGTISGDITISGSDKDLYWRSKGSQYELSFGIGSGNVNRGIFDGTHGHWWIRRASTTDTYIEYGNVGIGTTSPTEKLDVAGNVKASGNINATSITINGVTITASNGSITVNGNVLATGAITAKAVG